MARRCYELSDEQFERIEDLLPSVEGCGRPFKDHRKIINGIFWILRSGAPWRDLPERYGPWQTVYDRFRRWRGDGTLDRVCATRPRPSGPDRLVGLLRRRDARSSDSGRRRSRKKGDAYARAGTAGTAPDEALGRSRGGFTTKLHVVCDRRGLPLAAQLTTGQRHESTCFEVLLDGVCVKGRRGRARQRPERVIADCAYDAGRIRRWLRQHGIEAIIRPSPRRAVRRERPLSFNRVLYHERNVVERLIGHLKEHRRIGTRSEKLAASYLAMVKLAFIERYFRILDSPNTT